MSLAGSLDAVDMSNASNSTTTPGAPADAGPAAGTRGTRVDCWRGGVPHQEAAISKMESSPQPRRTTTTSQAPTECPEGTKTHSRTSDGEQLRTARWKQPS